MENTRIRTPVTTFKFTASIVMTIEAMMKLFSTNGLWMRLEGRARLDDLRKLPKPEYDLTFFHQIRASEIDRRERIEPGYGRVGSWRLSRIVEFEFEGVVVANVWLSGIKLDGKKGNHDNSSMWAISRIRYATKLEPDDKHGRIAKDWEDFKFEVYPYTSQYMG